MSKKEPAKVELEWGQTPWDSLSHEELLRTIWQYWIAMGELYSIVHGQRYVDEQMGRSNPFWGTDGRGGKALEMARQARMPVNERFDSESIYRSFFRYAYDLLFDSSEYEIGTGWHVCDTCGVMIGGGNRAAPLAGASCAPYGKKGCNGTFRKLSWDDLKPIEKP